MHEICTTKFEWGCIIKVVFFIQKQTNFKLARLTKPDTLGPSVTRY